MELVFIGTGSAFTMKNYQNNTLIRKNGKDFLVDAGTDIRFSLADKNLKATDIDSVYVSHPHADHIGGLEWLAFATYWTPHRINLYIHESWAEELWSESLKGGLQGIEGKKMSLSDYFNVIKVKDNEEFVWNEIHFNLVQTIHIYAQYSSIDSFGLMFNEPGGQRVYLTTDCQFAPETAQKSFYKEAGVIFHDCETSPFRSGVHSHYEDLKTLPVEVKNKMWLYHYQDNIVDNFDEYNKVAVEDGFLGFVRKGAIWNERYGMN